MRVWLLFGCTVLIAVLLTSNLVPAIVGMAASLHRSGDWLVLCEPGEGLCSARLELQKGEPKNTDVRGDFGLLHVNVYAYPSGKRAFSVDLSDDVLPKFVPIATPGQTLPFDGVRVEAVGIDGQEFPLTCVHHGCYSESAQSLIGVMARAKHLTLKPENRQPIEIDIRDFGRAYGIVERKIAGGEAVNAATARTERRRSSSQSPEPSQRRQASGRDLPALQSPR